jgi:hypothetical protein
MGSCFGYHWRGCIKQPLAFTHHGMKLSMNPSLTQIRVQLVHETVSDTYHLPLPDTACQCGDGNLFVQIDGTNGPAAMSGSKQDQDCVHMQPV